MLLAGLALLVLTSPADASGPQHRYAIPAPQAAGLEVAPAQVRLAGPLAQQRFLVTLRLSDGTRRDVTTAARFSSGAPKVASIHDGAVVARGDGSAVIAARYGKLAARALVVVTGAHRPVWYSFRNDVVPTLARVGCSAGACHGANSGKGGFKLSLRGYAPELDYVAITRQLGGRRLCREAPERSLILRKPTLQARHGGGRVLQIGSREYNTILGWLREGAPGVAEQDPKLTGLTALPGDRAYRPNEHQQILIRARFSDGHTEDVTARALFGSNDVAVAKVSGDGAVVALNPGATAVMAKYMDRLAVVRVTVPYARKTHPAAFSQPNDAIDEAVYAGLRKLNLEPSGLCTDAEFLRRVYVDVLGTLPTAAEARAFLDSRGPLKRARLIDAVLRRPEYASVWALKLADLFMMRKEHMERKNTLALQQWFTEQFRQNRPWDQLVTDILTASGPTWNQPQTLWYISRQQSRPNARGWVRSPELTGEIAAQVFLGTRIQCARCHNHPTEKYTQDDYYHFAAIFAQVNGEGPGDVVPQNLVARDVGEVRQPRTGEVMAAEPLDRADLNLHGSEDRRVKFARWLTGAGSELFSRNITNRIWARLFGSGIVEPVDDLRSTNPPRNEPLLAALARDLIAHHYDLKYLMATIMNSRTYQASSTPTPANKVDTQFFSHYPVRRLPAEEMMDAIAQVTGVPDRFATYPLGTRAIELSDSELPSLSLDVFGRPPRVMPIDSERCNAPSMSQALDLFNGEALQAKLKSPDGTVARLLKSGQSGPRIVAELFLSALARRPSPNEMAGILKMLTGAPSREEGVQDVLWALINSKEFMFDH